MKKTILAIACLCCSYMAVCQQDSSHFEKLLSQFSKAYADAAKTGLPRYFEQMKKASSQTLGVQNQVFLNTKAVVAQRAGIVEEDSAFIAVADSIYRRFIRTDMFWYNENMELFVFKDALILYNETRCECLTKNIKSNDTDEQFGTVDSCEKAMSADVASKAKINAALEKIPSNQKTAIVNFVYKYLYQNCPVFNRLINRLFLNIVLRDRNEYFYFLIKDAGKKIVRLQTTQKTDSLVSLFPAFDKYKDDIKKSAAFVDSPFHIKEKRNAPAPNGIIYTITYYKDEKQPKLLCQVIITCTTHDREIQVSGYEFVPAERIKNKDGIITELIEGIPPPPRVITTTVDTGN